MQKSIGVSGGFDPLHGGHLDLLEAAAEHGRVVVILNSDDWLRRKKGFAFQPWSERARLLSALPCVSEVVPADDADGTVVSTLESLRPDCFGNGGDRAPESTPELEACHRLGVEPVFGLGGDKTGSSSTIAARSTVTRDWGTYDVLAEGDWYKVKRLVINPGGQSSIQRHEHREEHWITADSYKHISKGEWHRLDNTSPDPLEVIEVQIGDCMEDDIERRDTWPMQR